MNHNYQQMMPDDFQEHYPEFNDGTGIPAEKGLILPVYELSEPIAIACAAF